MTIGTRKASSRCRNSECPSWPRRTGATCNVVAAAARINANPGRAQGCAVATTVAATATRPVTAQAAHRSETLADVGVGVVVRLASDAGARRHQLSPQVLPAQASPPQDEPPQDEPPQDEPPH